MEYLNQIKENISKYKEDMVKSLVELVQINSVADTPKADMPFGEGVTKALEYMLNKGEADEFAVANIDNYGGHIDLLPGDSWDGQVMGILAHLDVVPAGSDWDYDPFGGEIDDNKIYGRGTMDDKGPALAAYYAMKAIKEAKVPLSRKVRLVLGLDEETGSKGMEYYLDKTVKPDFGFTPDADFPVVHGEKNILIFELAKKLMKPSGKGIELRSFKGGNAPNMVPDFARAVVRADNPMVYEQLKEKAARAREEGKQIKTKGMGKSLEITAHGISAHGSEPQDGVNAISMLMEFFKDIEFINESVNDFIEFYNSHIGYELNGESLGIGFEDEISGGTVVNVGMIDLDTKRASMSVNVRFPISFDDETIYDGMSQNVGKYNIGVIKERYQEGIFVDPEDTLVSTLMDVYKKATGDEEAESKVIGGGTYARTMENFVAFGPLFPGQEDRIHQKNEYMDIDLFVKMTEIYAEAIFELCKA